MEAEYREAKDSLRSLVLSVHQSNGGSDDEREEDEQDSVSDMDMPNVDDVDNELHDTDLIAQDTCKGDPPPDPKRPRCAGVPKRKAPPPTPPSKSVDRSTLIAAIRNGSFRKRMWSLR